MAGQGNPIALTTEALFYGATWSSTDTNAVSAEAFYVKMDALRVSIPLNEVEAITRSINNFRGQAHEWWVNHVQSATDEYDRHRMSTDWAHFSEEFKFAYYKVQALADTVSDIADVKQKPNEDTSAYLSRLYTVLNPQITFSLAFTQGVLAQEDGQAMLPAPLAAHLADPIANPLALPLLTQFAGQAIHNAFAFGAKLRTAHCVYEHVMRTAARLCKSDRMRTFLRKNMFRNTRRVRDMQQIVRTEEQTYKVNSFTSGSGTPVAAIEDYSVCSMDGEATGLAAEYSGDEGDETADYGVHSICAISSRPKFQKKKLVKDGRFSQFLADRKKFKKPSGSSRAGPGNKAGGKKSNSFLAAWNFSCFACRSNGHKAADCNQLQKRGWTCTGAPAPAAKKQPVHPYNNSGRRPQAHEAMDTSAVEQQQQQQHFQQQQQQQQFYQGGYAAPPPAFNYAQYNNVAGVSALSAAPSFPPPQFSVQPDMASAPPPPPSFYGQQSGNE